MGLAPRLSRSLLSPRLLRKQVGDLKRVKHGPAWWPGSVAHIAVPVFTSTSDADSPAALGDIGNHDDFGTARHAPTFTKNVEFDFAKTTGGSHLLGRGDVLVTEENH